MKITKIHKPVVYAALGMSLATSTLAVWVFYTLGVRGSNIGPDRFNLFELGAAVVFLLVIFIAFCLHVLFMFARPALEKGDNHDNR